MFSNACMHMCASGACMCIWCIYAHMCVFGGACMCIWCINIYAPVIGDTCVHVCVSVHKFLVFWWRMYVYMVHLCTRVFGGACICI